MIPFTTAFLTVNTVDGYDYEILSAAPPPKAQPYKAPAVNIDKFMGCGNWQGVEGDLRSWRLREVWSRSFSSLALASILRNIIPEFTDRTIRHETMEKVSSLVLSVLSLSLQGQAVGKM